MKVDLRQAYDPIHWGFTNEVPRHMHFPDVLLNYVMRCYNYLKRNNVEIIIIVLVTISWWLS